MSGAHRRPLGSQPEACDGCGRIVDNRTLVEGQAEDMRGAVFCPMCEGMDRAVNLSNEDYRQVHEPPTPEEPRREEPFGGPLGFRYDWPDDEGPP